MKEKIRKMSNEQLKNRVEELRGIADNPETRTADELEALAEELDLEELTEYVEDKGGAYYAIKGSSYVYSTCGGLEVDTNLNVVDIYGKAVPGLYAVGNDSLGVMLASEKAYVTYGGAAAGWALTSGRLAGANAAAYAKGE